MLRSYVGASTSTRLVEARASKTLATNANASSEPLAQTTRSAGTPWRSPIQRRNPGWPPVE